MKSYLFPFLCIISLCLLFNSKSHLYIDKKKVYRLILVYILKKVYIIFINKLDNKNTEGGGYSVREKDLHPGLMRRERIWKRLGFRVTGKQ